jgi:hypothetical protein
MLDPGVHARLLVTVPLLVLAEHTMHALSARCIDRFVQNDFAAEGPAGIRRAVARGTRLRDAWIPELTIAIAAVVAGLAGLWGAPDASFARVWWSIVALPVAQFLLYRSFWRWVIWAVVLWGLADLDVRPVAVHPDRRGGLAFLAEPALGFALVVLALDGTVAGAWGGRMIVERAPLESFGLPFAEIVVACFIAALGPLCVFSRCLWRARFGALREYDRLALEYARAFHEKWAQTADPPGLLGTPDIQSMADLANTLAIVRTMRIVPFGLYEVTALLVAIGLPIVPLLIVELPLHELMKRALGVLAAGLPG